WSSVVRDCPLPRETRGPRSRESSVGTPQNRRDGARQNPQVELELPIPHICQLDIGTVRVAHVTPSVHCPGTRQPWLEREQHGRPFAVLVELVRHHRPGTDQRHLTANDIPELWQFIQAALPEESTHPSNAGVLSLRQLEVVPKIFRVEFRIA